MKFLSPTLFAPAYQELVILFTALLESTRAQPRLRRLDQESGSLKHKVLLLKQEAEISLQERDRRWQAEAETAIDLCFDTVLRTCFNGETWLQSGSRPADKIDIQLRYTTKLKALTSGMSEKGSPPQALIDLWRCCLNIIFHNDENALRELRAKLDTQLPRSAPLVLPRPAVKAARTVTPLLRWRVAAAMAATAMAAIFVGYFWAWRLTADELQQALREPSVVSMSAADTVSH